MIDFSEDMNNICNLPLKERHSYFQLHYFLIGKEPTNQSKMWKCIGELKIRKQNLISMEMEIEEINDDLEIIDIELKERKTKQQNRISEIEIKKIERRKKAKQLRFLEIKEKQKLVEEECVFLVKTFKNLNQIEELKAYDDVNSQKEYWNEKLAQEFNLRNRLSMPPDIELIKTILALNSDSFVKQDLLNMIKNENKPIDLTEEILLEKTKSNDCSANIDDIKKEKNDI